MRFWWVSVLAVLWAVSCSSSDTNSESVSVTSASGNAFEVVGETVVLNSDVVDCVIPPYIEAQPGTAKDFVWRETKKNVPSLNPKHCYLFSVEIPDDLRRYHADVHKKMIAYVGGYDNYVHITYELDGDNTEALAALEQMDYCLLYTSPSPRDRG